MKMTLDADKIIATVDALAQRVGERFPDAGLCRVAKDFTLVARKARGDAVDLGRPNWRLRLMTSAILAIGFVLLAFVITELHFSAQFRDVGTLIQILEPAANIAILVALGIVFIVRAEGRSKQKRALTSLHSLRSMIHVIDMHQLTKDPSALLDGLEPTASSPQRSMNRIELQRYLDYCSEMLSLSGKLAALYNQSVQDQLIIETVNELEALSTNLTRKIWQKIMILDRGTPVQAAKKPAKKTARKTAKKPGR